METATVIRELQRRAAEPTPRTQRATLAESVQNLIDNSALKRCVESGDFAGWPEAAIADTAAANVLLKTMWSDIDVFLSVRHKPIGSRLVYRNSVRVQDLCGDQERCEALWNEFKNMSGVFYSELRKLRSESGEAFRLRWSQHVRFRSFQGDLVQDLIPASVFSIDRDVAEFEFADSPTSLKRRTLVRAAFVCPDDFPRYQPPVVRELLDAAEKTVIDWKPAILDGVLVSEQSVPLIDPKDPALVLRTGFSTNIMLHYWADPKTAEQRESLAIDPWRPEMRKTANTSPEAQASPVVATIDAVIETVTPAKNRTGSAAIDALICFAFVPIGSLIAAFAPGVFPTSIIITATIIGFWNLSKAWRND